MTDPDPDTTSAPAPNPASRLLVPAAAAATLGLAPFRPQPHVVEKLRWIASGADGMAALDWFDLAMHGAPWVWLAVEVVLWLRRR